MAIVYHYDLYPANDPRDGARLVRFTDLQDADYRQVVGVGSWQAVIRANMAEAANIDPDGEQYVRVVRDDGATEAVVGGGFISRMAYDAATASETKRLTFGGPTTMAYLARAAMAPHSYLSEFIPGSWGGDPFDRIWRLHLQGSLAGGAYLGAMLWRVLQEATHYRSGATYKHTHKDQTHVTDAHDDDRTENALPALTLGFTQYLDSNGNAWSLTSGDFTAQVGENVLGVVHRLMQAGLYLEMDPDTFELNAWENEDHRRDRTGAALGAAVVRLQAPTDGTVATASYKSDVKRIRTSHIRRSTLWVGGGEDTYVKATGASPIPREGFIASDVNDAAALAQIGSTQVTAREEASDVGSVRIKLGSDPVNGYYLPFEDVRVDDLITVHTGTDNWDFTEATYPVAAVRIKLREAGDWDAFVELGGSLETAEQRQFQIATQAAHTHPPNPAFCPYDITEEISCANASTVGTPFTLVEPGLEGGYGNWYDGFGQTQRSNAQARTGSWSYGPTAHRWYHFDGQTFQLGKRYVVRFWTLTPAASGGPGAEFRFGKSTTSTPSLHNHNGFTEYAGEVWDNSTEAGLGWVQHCVEWEPTATYTDDVRIEIHVGTAYVDDLEVFEGELQGTSSTGLHGTSPYAARCDHEHEPEAHTHDEYALDTDLTAAIAAIDFENAGHWEPVTNGDTAAPEIVFDAGDVVMEWVP